MKKTLTTLVLLSAAILMPASARKPNYDESKVGKYTLEDPLTFLNGKRVRNAKDWARRRVEILDIFQREMYGQMPPKPEALVVETIEEGETLAGFATRRQLRMWFRADKTGPKIDWLVITPCHAPTPAPTVLLLNYEGNQTVLPDKEILITDSWLRNGKDAFISNHRASEQSRGLLANPNSPAILPAAMLVAQGYAVVTACYGDISPDPHRSDVDPSGKSLQEEFAYTKMFSLWGQRDPARTDNTTALAAWAWGLMRGMDMIERDSLLDASRVILTGYSRLAKAALIAGAFDERFPVVVANQTGGGGVPLAKRNFGENIGTEVESFKHWYCKAYCKYADNEEALTFDQHLLVSCIAPRALLVEGFDEQWFDTRGEFLSVQAASPVWKLLGKKGLPKVAWPDDYDTSAIGPTLGYVRRSHKHGIAAIDWVWMTRFAAKVFKANQRKTKKN